MHFCEIQYSQSNKEHCMELYSLKWNSSSVLYSIHLLRRKEKLPFCEIDYQRHFPTFSIQLVQTELHIFKDLLEEQNQKYCGEGKNKKWVLTNETLETWKSHSNNEVSTPVGHAAKRHGNWTRAHLKEFWNKFLTC